eukprot:158193-Prymnesium_polylepis.2
MYHIGPMIAGALGLGTCNASQIDTRYSGGAFSTLFACQESCADWQSVATARRPCGAANTTIGVGGGAEGRVEAEQWMAGSHAGVGPAFQQPAAPCNETECSSVSSRSRRMADRGVCRTIDAWIACVISVSLGK